MNIFRLTRRRIITFGGIAVACMASAVEVEKRDGDFEKLPRVARPGSQGGAGILHYATTAAETAAGVIPVDHAHPPGNVKRYGAKGDGLNDDTAAFNLAFTFGNYFAFDWFYPNPPLDHLKMAAQVVYFPAGDYIYNVLNGVGFGPRSGLSP